ncbi:hypothetical protein KOW79_007425 [Hemibagrus wyckioides]|uniref:Uncharacterized protein n=1 Tax=Hemibagrus wyckioides TaxID=337641 RepID=A0A9D3NVF2_9TELE|nr:hypothetical protein KOW79_007425 [Hemibagrus wyckioides]
MKEGDGPDEAEEDYNEVEWQRSVRRGLQQPALRVRRERGSGRVRVSLSGSQSEGALPTERGCWGKAGCRNFFLFGLLVFLLGVLTAFSGAVVDGDAVSLVERKYSRYCLDTVDVPAACGRLKDYQRGLVASTVLNALECLIGLVNLVVIKRYQAAQFYRRRRAHRRSAREVLLAEERELTVAHDFRSVSYISLAVCGSQAREDGAEARKSGHPSIELPGYAPVQNELHHVYGFSYPPANDSPPAYEDIFPGERRIKALEC